MGNPDFKPLPPTREGRSREERSKAASAVDALLASDGWAELEAAIDDRLRYEQRHAMSLPAGSVNEAQHERRIGSWSGLRKIRALAEGIVADGNTAEAEMRKAS